MKLDGMIKVMHKDSNPYVSKPKGPEAQLHRQMPKIKFAGLGRAMVAD